MSWKLPHLHWWKNITPGLRFCLFCHRQERLHHVDERFYWVRTYAVRFARIGQVPGSSPLSKTPLRPQGSFLCGKILGIE